MPLGTPDTLVGILDLVLDTGQGLGTEPGTAQVLVRAGNTEVSDDRRAGRKAKSFLEKKINLKFLFFFQNF